LWRKAEKQFCNAISDSCCFSSNCMWLKIHIRVGRLATGGVNSASRWFGLTDS
jgi:hypothetical protein